MEGILVINGIKYKKVEDENFNLLMKNMFGSQECLA